MKQFFLVVAALAVVWLLAFAVARIARSEKPTATGLAAYVAAHPLPESDAERQRILKKVAERLNRLGFEERRTFRQSDQLDQFFQTLTPEERGQFLDLTLPEGFRQIMQALNKMSPEQRKKVVDRALANLQADDEGRRGRPLIAAEEQQKIIAHGITSFYEEASAETKLGCAPVIEQIQYSMQHRE